MQNVVSSLPFLAPIFLRKAKEYTSKYSGSANKYGSGARNKLGGKSADAYKLSSTASSQKHKGGSGGTFATAQAQSTGSEENILRTPSTDDHAIVKSVTYSVRVD